jgi:hypothetical protein
MGFGGAAFAAVFATLSVAGCGPSFQAVHDGEARFEHCYALDENPRASLEKKADCWNDWAHHFTYGQTQDRVQYAVQRYQALSRVPALPTDEAMMSAAPGEGVSPSTIAAPAPTSAFAPPPKTLDGDAGGAAPAPGALPPGGGAPKNPKVVPVPSAAAQASSAPARPPGAGCLDDCSSTWGACRSGCETKKCDECDKTYRACLRRCAK